MLNFWISFLPSPLDSEPPSIDNELVEGLLSSHFSRLPCGKLDKGTLLPLDYGNGTDLTKLVEVTPAENRNTSSNYLKHLNQSLKKKNLTKLAVGSDTRVSDETKALLEISICNSISQTPYVEGGDGLVLWWVQSGHGRGSLQQLISHWIVDTIITVLYVLVSKWVIRICGLLVSVKPQRQHVRTELQHTVEILSRKYFAYYSN